MPFFGVTVDQIKNHRNITGEGLKASKRVLESDRALIIAESQGDPNLRELLMWLVEQHR